MIGGKDCDRVGNRASISYKFLIGTLLQVGWTGQGKKIRGMITIRRG